MTTAAAITTFFLSALALVVGCSLLMSRPLTSRCNRVAVLLGKLSRLVTYLTVFFWAAVVAIEHNILTTLLERLTAIDVVSFMGAGALLVTLPIIYLNAPENPYDYRRWAAFGVTVALAVIVVRQAAATFPALAALLAMLASFVPALPL